ncbi:hypothetical protein ACIGW7_39810 [Streptomyces sp. NPDC053253]|uniref:hypothetical protein n=1 Tax=Streptomyces sp. NPDC053253 TaxID=3365699 RepID=UPI0037D96BEB
MTTAEAAVDIVAVIPEPAPTPPLELVPDLPVTPITEIGLAITNALVDAWNAIRARHSDVPEAVITMATGGRESAVKLAHFSRNRWKAVDGDATHHEVFVTAESLLRGAVEAMETLVHEATHGVNVVRGVDDCSVSQYHNKSFKAVALELGMEYTKTVDPRDKKKYGFAFPVLGDEAKEAYADQIAALDKAIQATRVPAYIPVSTGGGGKGKTTTGTTELDDADGEEKPPRPEKEDRNYVKATCQCSPPATIRVSPKTLAKKKIMCGDCKEDFTTPEIVVAREMKKEWEEAAAGGSPATPPAE